ncbi:MAG: nucleoside phosphorylase [Desulfobacterales bacterium]|nr:nucleoside phosphorylase [Desulfobacterales bacterium]
MVIRPQREKGESGLPPSGLFLLNPGDAARAGQLAADRGAKKRFLFHGRLAVVPETENRGPFFIAGPAVGAPMAAMTLEKLIALGGQRILVAGWCGSLVPGLGLGSVLLPTWALSEEGTSTHYPVDRRPESPVALREQVRSGLAAAGFATSTGPVWTTDGLYRESRAKVNQYGSKGILAVEMEYAALATVAAFRSIELAGALLVSDALWPETWQPGFRSRDFREKNALFVSALLDLAGKLAL